MEEKKWINISNALLYQEGPGVRNTQYTTDGVKLLNVANLTDGKIDLSTSDRYISCEEANGKYKHFLCDEGDLVVASSGIKVDYVDKKMGFVTKEMLPLCMNTSTIRFKVIDKRQLNIRYFMYYLKSQNYKKQLSKLITGSAQLNYGPSHLEKIVFPLYKIEKQEEIVLKLDLISKILEHNKIQISKYDELIKARFIELFIGKGYPTKTIDEVSLGKGEYGAQSASIKYDPTRPRYVRITDINDDGTLNDDVVASINPDDDEQYRLEYGDFLFARMGATVGKTFTFIAGNQIFAGYLIRYKLNQKLINPRYLFWYTKLNEYWNWVKLNQSGAAQPGINAKKYGSLRIPVPPIEQQEKFADFVQQVDKSKFRNFIPHKYDKYHQFMLVVLLLSIFYLVLFNVMYSTFIKSILLHFFFCRVTY